MAVKTTFSTRDFVEILSDYNLGEYKHSKPFTTGAVQTNFLLQTTKGRFAFKYYENRSEESVLFESDLIRHLTARNYPCPPQCENKDGKLVGNYKGKPFVIFGFVQGRQLKNPSESQRKQLVRKVAELQNITKDYRPKNAEFRLNYNVETCRELARKTAKKINTANANEKLKWYESELSQLELPESLPKGICHCDFHFSNVLFDHGEFRALMDFDDANYTFLLYDLAALIDPFLFVFGPDTWSKFKKDENVFDFTEPRKTVAEYMKHRLLSDGEKEHLFDVLKLSIMVDCLWRFERGNADDFFEKRKIDCLNSMGRQGFYKKLFGAD
jgi:Ser/Thr protein kinase RdoA (MazF antagonist)